MSISPACRAAGLLAVFLLTTAQAFAQADYARERRLADEITPGIVGGDAVELRSRRKFLAIYAPIISSPDWRGSWGGRSGNSSIRG